MRNLPLKDQESKSVIILRIVEVGAGVVAALAALLAALAVLL